MQGLLSLRRKNGGMLGGRRCSSLAATALICIMWVGSTRLLLRGQVTRGDADYLYKIEGGQPVIDVEAGSNLQFKRSPNQRVVEFYDPNCGACQVGAGLDLELLSNSLTCECPTRNFQAFRWNYIEIAKKVRYELAFASDIIKAQTRLSNFAIQNLAEAQSRTWNSTPCRA